MHDLWERLRRRKLIQWGLAYVAAAWLLLQALDVLDGLFGLPAAIPAVIAVLLATGFLSVLVLAWYHGEKGRQRAGLVEVGLIGAVLVVGGFGAATLGRRAGDAESASRADLVAASALPALEPEQNSVAVLPFVNMSPDPDDEYFSDGITEEILNALAQVRGLRVPARTSSFYFKERSAPVGDIARRLQVAYVVEGSVRRSTDRVRITAQMIDARDDRHVWSQNYDRALHDVFAVQSEIAGSIARALVSKLVLPARSGMADVGTDHFGAYEAYLHARHHWNRRTTEGMHRALELLDRAIAADSGFARAWALLAEAHTLFPQYDVMAPGRAFPIVERAAARALALDSTLAAPHAALGFMYIHRLRPDDAERAFRTALALEPAYGMAYDWYAYHLALTGRIEEGIQAMERARRLDPLSAIIRVHLAEHLHAAGRYDEALEHAAAALELMPSSARAMAVRARIHGSRGDSVRAIEFADRALKQPGQRTARELTLAGLAYAAAGEVARTREVLAQLESRISHGTGYVSPGFLGILLETLGEAGPAAEMFARARATDAPEATWRPDRLGRT